MKIKRLFTLIILPLLIYSCEDDTGGFTQIKGEETLVYLAIKGYRTSNAKTGPFVHQFLLVTEAQIYSYKMANDVQAINTDGLQEHWDDVMPKLGGYNEHALVMSSQTNDADAILAGLLQLPNAETILLEDVTQCGVGIEYDSSGTNYITIMLMKVDD